MQRALGAVRAHLVREFPHVAYGPFQAEGDADAYRFEVMHND